MTSWTGFVGGPAGWPPPLAVADEGPAAMLSTMTTKTPLLRCQARSQDFERKLSKRFSVSEEILSQCSVEVLQTSLLLALPVEVLLVIYSIIDHAPSQICFAVTCKRLSAAAQRVSLSRSLTSPKYAGFLPAAVFDVPDLMRALQPWVPGHLRLCGHCLTYRPVRAEYWHTVPGFETNDFWAQKVGWEFKGAGWRKQVHDICPSCHWSCTLSDYIDCDGCRALGRLGDVDWSRVSQSVRRS